ncbi:MAG: CrcB family protein [Acidobacteria bacterium]|nr:MAG: CrcB family protein [Acidobacteriota bacterium]REK08357.1 MAG: CrcB family protein [Acidobacteriota bacterium]
MSQVAPFLLAALGGAIGAAARYGVNLALLRSDGFPAATITVNLVGCFLIGLLLGAGNGPGLALSSRALLATGVLGGFTTFSAFAYELHSLLGDAPWTALGLALLQVVAGVLLVGIGAVCRQALA